ncbi:MAG: ribonuclease Z [Candidatus Aenigmatarchaeota archaeon]|nr:ribonuclease Z [Candidatus Aenigmarchaeota archaeon]
MIVITFLGTVSGIPTLDRNHPAIVLEHYTNTRDVLLFDCGEGTQKQLMKAGISFMQISKIFITHWHADHFAGLIPMIQTMNLEKRKKPLIIYGPEAEKFVSNILDLGYFGVRFPIEARNVEFEGNAITKIDETDDYEIYTTPAYHTVPSVAYCFKEKDKWNIDEGKLDKLGLKRGAWLRKLKKDGSVEVKGKKIDIKEIGYVKKGLKVVYSGDTKPHKNIANLAKEADLLIHDGTFLEEDVSDKSHSDVKKAAELAETAKVKQLVLTHISRRYTDTKELEEQARKSFANTMIAKDMMKVVLKS